MTIRRQAIPTATTVRAAASSEERLSAAASPPAAPPPTAPGRSKTPGPQVHKQVVRLPRQKNYCGSGGGGGGGRETGTCFY